MGAHTIASDGSLTIEQLANEAKRRGCHTIAVTDHSNSKASAQANGLSPERLLAHIDAIRETQFNIKGITILAGSEAASSPMATDFDELRYGILTARRGWPTSGGVHQNLDQ